MRVVTSGANVVTRELQAATYVESSSFRSSMVFGNRSTSPSFATHFFNKSLKRILVVKLRVELDKGCRYYISPTSTPTCRMGRYRRQVCDKWGSTPGRKKNDNSMSICQCWMWPGVKKSGPLHPYFLILRVGSAYFWARGNRRLVPVDSNDVNHWQAGTPRALAQVSNVCTRIWNTRDIFLYKSGWVGLITVVMISSAVFKPAALQK